MSSLVYFKKIERFFVMKPTLIGDDALDDQTEIRGENGDTGNMEDGNCLISFHEFLCLQVDHGDPVDVG